MRHRNIWCVESIPVAAVGASFFSPPSENSEDVPVVELFAELAGVLPNNPPPPNKLELAEPLLTDVEVVLVAGVLLAPVVVTGLGKLKKPVVATAGVVPEVLPSEKTGGKDRQVGSRNHRNWLTI